MSRLPEPKTIAIIGAGIVGVSTAIWLMREGHSVILIDRNAEAGEGASLGNAGLLASAAVVPMNVPGLTLKAPGMLLNPSEPLFMKWRALPQLTPWIFKFLKNATDQKARAVAAGLHDIVGNSVAEHQSLAAGTGAEKWITPSDYLVLYKDRDAFVKDHYTWDLRQQLGVQWDEFEGNDFIEYDPVFSRDLSFAARLRDHGRITDPGRYIKDLATHIVSKGGRMLHAEVDDIARENGRVTGIRAGGETIACDAVVLATGAWSKPLAKKLGVSVPLETERGYHIELWGPSFMPRAPVMVTSGKFVMTPMDGRVRLAGVVELGGLKPAPSRAPIALLHKHIQATLPGLTWEHESEWMGFRPTLADSLPVIGAVPGVKGAYLGFGHQHIGLTGGPKTGRLLAQMISETPPNIDMSRYAPERF